ncbi:hypothetical protein [Bacteroides congonensis]|uniref:hypothetical protein n=1 Tax=Bacteroides congonensis TaxID=1871006 RepID=UPI003A856E54
MLSFRKLKSVLGFALDGKSGFFAQILKKLNLYIFHYDQRYHKESFGDLNPDKIFYVIRPSSEAEGLLSLFFTVIRNVQYAELHGMIPVVDFENYKTQYSRNESLFGKFNAWEYFFKPVSKYELSEVYHSKNVYLFGWGRPQISNSLFQNDYNETINKERNIFINKYTGLSLNVMDNVRKYENLFKGTKVLGVFLRGTDYLKLKPTGHPIQPAPFEVVNKVKEYIAKYDIEHIFIVTEDQSLFELFKSKFGDIVFSIDNSYIDSYKEGYVYTCLNDKDPYEKGLTYITKLLLLNKCDYLVTTLTNGSLFTLAMKEGDFTDKYIFNLGKY